MCIGQQPVCEEIGGIWNGTSQCPNIDSNGCNESNWEEYYPEMQGCDLAWADLEGADLSYANLEGADLSFADLDGANCYGAFFVGVTLSYVYPPIDQFEGAVLTYAYFDVNGDEYDDVSYDAGFDAGFQNSNIQVYYQGYADGYDAGYDAGAESGDLNLDGIDNVLDVVILVNNILNP